MGHVGARCSGEKKIDYRIFSSLTSRKKMLSTSESISFDNYILDKYRTERIVTKMNTNRPNPLKPLE